MAWYKTKFMAESVTKNCEHCGGEYQTTRPSKSRFCSTAHRVAFNRGQPFYSGATEKPGSQNTIPPAPHQWLLERHVQAIKIVGEKKAEALKVKVEQFYGKVETGMIKL